MNNLYSVTYVAVFPMLIGASRLLQNAVTVPLQVVFPVANPSSASALAIVPHATVATRAVVPHQASLHVQPQTLAVASSIACKRLFQEPDLWTRFCNPEAKSPPSKRRLLSSPEELDIPPLLGSEVWECQPVDTVVDFEDYDDDL